MNSPEPPPPRLRRAALCAALLALALTSAGCGGKKQTARNVPPAPELAPAPELPPAAEHAAPESVPGIHVDPNAPVLWSEVGYASWYGPQYNRKKAANGEIYNQDEMTAAHNTLPLNSIVRVVNLKNNQSTVVRITDRGPFVGDRIIDLSVAAAKAVNVYLPGTARVRLDVLEAPHPIEIGGRWCVQIGAFQSQVHRHRAEKPSPRCATPEPRSSSSRVPPATGSASAFPRTTRQKTRKVFEQTEVKEGGVFMVRLD